MLGAWAIKRFYKHAAARAVAGGFALTLDSRLVKTPAHAPLVVPSRALAEAIAGEWAAQGERIRPRDVPLMSLACTAIDRVVPSREDAIQDLVAYAETDLVCYRAQSPADLAARQQDAWQPLLDWVFLRYDAQLAVTVGIIPVTQPRNAVSALRRALEGRESFELAALAGMVRATGSLVIGLALAGERLTTAEAFAAAQLDETYQMEIWGEDSEAVRRRSALEADLESATRFLRLL
jgi:chaperone required for assembly of F1-ATPase